MRQKHTGALANVSDALLLVWREASSYVKWRLAVILLLTVVTSLVNALAPLALKFVIDGITTVSRVPPEAYWILAVYVCAHWVARVTSEGRSVLNGQADRRMHRALSEKLFSHVLRLPMRFHLERQTGGFNEVLTNGLSGCQTILNSTVFMIIPIVVELCTVSVVLTSLRQAPLLVIFLVALTCYAIVFRIGIARSTGPARDAAAAQIEARAVMTDGLLNYETIKYFNAEAVVGRRFDGALSRNESDWVRFYARRAVNGAFVGTIFIGFLAATLFYALHGVAQGGMTVGDFVLVNAYAFQLVRPIEAVGAAMQQLAQGVVFVERMLSILREEPEPASPPIVCGWQGAGQLELKNVSVSYRPEHSVLNNVSFLLPPGKTLAIVGASGAGKSTLVRVLIRLFETDSGTIELDGVPITELPISQLRGAISIVPQDTVLFNDTIGYNIAFGREGSSQEEIERVARLAELHGFISTLPDGYATRVGERGVKLSGGEKQRIAIARALIRNPRIFVFDEATSSLDTQTERQILKNLAEISDRRTTLVIAHRLSTVTHADEILVLQQGAVAERGTHASLLARSGCYAKLWSAQQNVVMTSRKTG